MDDLRERAIRGGFAKLCAQAASLALRLGYIVVMARLLEPEDFGLVAMVIVVTGVYELFSTAGLSSATIQRDVISNQQISNLFWVNILVGAILALACLATAPVLVTFYSDTRIFWITTAVSGGFLLTGAGVQHVALLQRELQYVTLAAIEVAAQLVAYALGVCMAFTGLGYWSLVAAAVATPSLTTVFSWIATGWLPNKPRRNVAIAPMLRFGGTITLNTLVVYIAYNFDKLLLGRVWGADVLGIYGRAYQLVTMPTHALNGAIGSVAFSALSRLQNDPLRLKNYFLNSYTMVISLTVPIALFAVLFAEDIVSFVLGRKWVDAVPIFRFLSPTVLVLSIINPTSWLLFAIGKQKRSLCIAFVIAPIVMISYVIGLPYGPNGVALAYSTAMTLWVIPHVCWCLSGTPISPRELFLAVWRPFTAGLLAAIPALVLSTHVGTIDSVTLRLLIGAGTMSIVYVGVLLFVFRQKERYQVLLNPLLPVWVLRPFSGASKENGPPTSRGA